MKKSPGKVSRFYARDVVGVSLIANKFFFAPKVELLPPAEPGGRRIMRVVGKKIDITDQLQEYLLKKYRTTKKPDPKSFKTTVRPKRS